MYVRRSSLRSCYSQPLLSYVPPCVIANTCERCLHTATTTRQRPHGGRSFRVALFSINAWAYMRRAPTARPIKANYLKIVTIRPLYRDPMPLMLSYGMEAIQFAASFSQIAQMLQGQHDPCKKKDLEKIIGTSLKVTKRCGHYCHLSFKSRFSL